MENIRTRSLYVLNLVLISVVTPAEGRANSITNATEESSGIASLLNSHLPCSIPDFLGVCKVFVCQRWNRGTSLKHPLSPAPVQTTSAVLGSLSHHTPLLLRRALPYSVHLFRGDPQETHSLFRSPHELVLVILHWLSHAIVLRLVIEVCLEGMIHPSSGCRTPLRLRIHVVLHLASVVSLSR